MSEKKEEIIAALKKAVEEALKRYKQEEEVTLRTRRKGKYVREIIVGGETIFSILLEDEHGNIDREAEKIVSVAFSELEERILDITWPIAVKMIKQYALENFDVEIKEGRIYNKDCSFNYNLCVNVYIIRITTTPYCRERRDISLGLYEITYQLPTEAHHIVEKELSYLSPGLGCNTPR